jgi:hypothetical protein
MPSHPDLSEFFTSLSGLIPTRNHFHSNATFCSSLLMGGIQLLLASGEKPENGVKLVCVVI